MSIESAIGTKADVRRPLPVYGFTPQLVGTIRHVALPRAITVSSAVTRHCAKQIVLPS
jgi:hypothetical protein